MPTRNEYKRIVKQLIQTHLVTSIGTSFLVSGHDKTAMEIAQLTLYNRMYLKLIKEFEASFNNKSELIQYEFENNLVNSSDYIWTLWLQGENQVPDCVKTCIDSIRSFYPDKKVVILDENNLSSYISIPAHVQQKYNAGLISKTHLSDIVRIILLTQYGGTWIDSTVLLTSRPESFYTDSPLLFLRSLPPGASGQRIPMSSWFITSQQSSKSLILIRELLFEYWLKHDHLVDYFFLHYCIRFAADKFPEEWNAMPPVSNEYAQALLIRLDQPYSERLWDHMKHMSPLHKTSYKVANTCDDNSYFHKILIERNLPQ